VYRLHGSYDEALAAFERALALHRNTNDVAGIGQSMNAVAVALRVLGRTAEAISAASSAVSYLERHADRTGTLALTCHTLATALEDAGRPDEALQAVDRGLAAAPTPQDRPLLLATRASLLSALGRAEEAEVALSGAESQASPRQDIRALLLGTRVELLARAGHVNEALDSSSALIRTFEEQRARAAPVDGLKAGFDNVHQWAWAQRVRLLADAGRHSEALEATEGARARALADLLAARRLEAAESLEPRGRTGDDLPPSNSTSPLSPSGPGRRPSRDRVQVASPVVAAPPRLSDIAAHAERLDSTVVSYWVERDAVRIWTVDAEANVHHAVVRIDTRRLAALVRTSRATDDARARVVTAGVTASLRSGKAARALRELHELLITPVARSLPRVGRRRLTIVPHGPLFRLSFAALRAASGRYLLEDFEIHYTPSMAVLSATETVAGRVASSGVLVVAAPKPGRDASAQGLEALPGAEAEGKAVAAWLGAGAGDLLIGAGASESQVRRLASGKRVLHFASHAVVSDDHPLDSFLSLADETEGAVGADARLTAQEVYGLRLDADLAVLSACRTGGGRTTGEGMGALVRAFVSAGTPSIVATLWDLPDISGAFALPRFYRERARGAGKASALRSAQLALLRDLRASRLTLDTAAGQFVLPEHPKYWAGFVITGEP
jgi:CHAT domain-containing protein